jgi:triacylglycerol lipase
MRPPVPNEPTDREDMQIVGGARSLLIHREMRQSRRPIWLEVGAVCEWAILHASPVYYGLGIARGDGSAVILVPGFLGTDAYLWELNLWLRRIGYRPYMSGIGWNAECLNTLVERLAGTIEAAAKETGRRVHLIGHSLGGILARGAAQRLPERVASLITLGSPFRGICAHPLVFVSIDRVGEMVRRRRPEELGEQCFTAVCNCDAVSSLGNHLPTGLPHVAVYSRTDGIVDWKVCTHDDSELNVEVQGSHIGMVFNHAVYSLIAEWLAGSAHRKISPAAP